MSTSANKQPGNEASQGTVTSYVFGFGLSLALTLVAYLMVSKHVNSHHLVFSDNFLLIAVSALALTQLFVQLIFFLHLDRESKPRWNNTVLAFAAVVVLILVGGSIWIMTNLNYHHAGHGGGHNHNLTPQQINQQIIKDEGIQSTH